MTGEVIHLRNAGARLDGVAQSWNRILEEGNIPELLCMDWRLSDRDAKDVKKPTVLPHNDCGAMGFVEAVVTEKQTASERIMEKIVNAYKGAPFANREELEAVNAELQRKRIGGNGEVELQHVGKNSPHAEKVLLIAKPSSLKFDDLIWATGFNPKEQHVYVVQAYWIDEILPDIEVAVRKPPNGLGITNVVLLANGSAEYRQVNADLTKLATTDFIKDLKIEPTLKKVDDRKRLKS